jgi:hypothetical protein
VTVDDQAPAPAVAGLGVRTGRRLVAARHGAKGDGDAVPAVDGHDRHRQEARRGIRQSDGALPDFILVLRFL